MANKDSRDPRYLSGDQQTLLRAALASNKSKTEPATVSMTAIEKNPDNLLFEEPDGLDDFDPDDPLNTSFYEGDTSYDSTGAYISEAHEKRKAEDDSQDSDEGDSKRREGDDKQAKKPGRKPLTTEPTTKRKAQNRAAQRAFRERKEKHLKDLETKVAEMTKESEIDKQQNGILKAQVDRLQAELKEYRSRMSSDSSRGKSSSIYNAAGPQGGFTFQFPSFGNTGTTNSTTNGNAVKTGAANTVSPPPRASANASPASNSVGNGAPLRQSSSDMQALAGLFSPGILNNAAAASASPDYGFPRSSVSPATQPLRYGSTTSNSGDPIFRLNSESGRSNTHSPSQSSMSQFAMTSSSNTSPAVSQHPSPPKDQNGSNGLASINELTMPHSANANSIDWLASQNGGQFDPVLFGDYRETQEAIIGDGDFNNGFFNDAFPFDFGSPMNLPDLASPKPATAQTPDKSDASKRLLAEVEKTQAGVDDAYGLPEPTQQIQNSILKCNGGMVAPDPNAGPLLSANAIWHQLQNNKAFQEGSFDLDSLCDELKSKAKCSESGMAVAQADVVDTFNKLAGKPHEDEHSLVWDEAFVNDTLGKLTSTTGGSGAAADSWGGFGLTNEQLNQNGW